MLMMVRSLIRGGVRAGAAAPFYHQNFRLQGVCDFLNFREQSIWIFRRKPKLFSGVGESHLGDTGKPGDFLLNFGSAVGAAQIF